MPSFDPGFTTPRMTVRCSPDAIVQSLFDFEVALAASFAAVGQASQSQADAIATTARVVRQGLSGSVVLAEGWIVGSPVIVVVDRMRGALDAAAGSLVHRGATSQDAMDTVFQLMIRDAAEMLVADLCRASAGLAEFAAAHRDTACVARTLGMHADLITHGLRAAHWATQLDAVGQRLAAVGNATTVQFGGAVDTGIGASGQGAEVVRDVALRLGLGVPDGAWQTDRSRIHDVAAAVAGLASTAEAIAQDLVVLAGSDATEITLRSGGSSAMAHKRNPIDAVRAIAAARAAWASASSLLAPGGARFERAAGAWQHEWFAIPMALMTAAGALDALNDCVTHLALTPGALAGQGEVKTDERELIDAAATTTSRLLGRHRTVTRRILDMRGTRNGVGVTHGVAWTEHGTPSGTPLVLLHSLGATSRMWAPQTRSFREYRIITIDLPGHGRSAIPKPGSSLDDLGAAVAEALDDAAVDRYHVAGISLGGQLAQWLAIHHPARIVTLTAANTASKIGTSELWSTRIATIRAAGLASIRRAVMERWCGDDFAEREPQLWSMLIAAFEATEVEGYAACCAALASADLTDKTAGITAPTLVISGEADLATPPLQGQELAEQIPRAELVVIPGAAHLSNLDRGQSFDAELRRFLVAHPVGSNP